MEIISGTVKDQDENIVMRQIRFFRQSGITWLPGRQAVKIRLGRRSVKFVWEFKHE